MDPTIVRQSRLQAIWRLIGCAAACCFVLWALSGLPASQVDLVRKAKGAVFLSVAMPFLIVGVYRYSWGAYRPGSLTIGTEGITEDLGWRKLHCSWDEVDRTEVFTPARGRVSMCLVYLKTGRRISLFGWELSPEDLQPVIERYRLS